MSKVVIVDALDELCRQCGSGPSPQVALAGTDFAQAVSEISRRWGPPDVSLEVGVDPSTKAVVYLPKWCEGKTREAPHFSCARKVAWWRKDRLIAFVVHRQDVDLWDVVHRDEVAIGAMIDPGVELSD